MQCSLRTCPPVHLDWPDWTSKHPTSESDLQTSDQLPKGLSQDSSSRAAWNQAAAAPAKAASSLSQLQSVNMNFQKDRWLLP